MFGLGPLLGMFEVWAVNKLIRSPTFHRAVRTVHRKVNNIPDTEAKNGLGRTGPSSLDTFKDELANQFRDLTWQKRKPPQ